MSFKHQPLAEGEIRLLKIQPSKGAKADIVTELIHVPLSKAPPYEALSYTWGTTKTLKYIQVFQSTLLVTENLHGALQNFRLTQEPRWMWVDAICIDQNNNEEKSQQILRMYTIYNSASRGLIWLGPQDDTTETAITHLLSLSEERPHQIGEAIGEWTEALPKVLYNADLSVHFHALLLAIKYQWVFFACVLGLGSAAIYFIRLPLAPYSSATVSEKICHLLLDIVCIMSSTILIFDLWLIYAAVYRHERARRLLPADVHVALIHFFSRPWFRRVWILQEVAGSNNAIVCCGKYTMSWATLSKSLDRMQEVAGMSLVDHPYKFTGFDDAAFINLLLRKDTLEQLASHQQTFAYLQGYFGHLEASDPRDKVYGLLSLANHFGEGECGILRTPLRPDYDLPVNEVFTQSAIHCIMTSGGLDVLRAVDDTKAIVGLPSWVPDWTSSRAPHMPHPLNWHPPFVLSLEDNDTIGVPSFSEDSKILHVQGFRIGEVRSNISFDPPLERITAKVNDLNLMANQKIMDPLRNLMRTNQDLDKQENSNDFLLHVGRLAVHFDLPEQFFLLNEMVKRDSHVCSADTWRRALLPSDAESLTGHPPWPHRMPARMIGWIPDLELLAPFGCIISTSLDAQPGDLICMFVGVDVPFLVRKTDDDFYKLIGPIDMARHPRDHFTIWTLAVESYHRGDLKLSQFAIV